MVMRFRRLLFIALMVIPTVGLSKDINPDVLLRCISEVESNNVSTKIGSHGERSRYQIMPQTWSMYSRTPFRLIGQEKYQTEVEKVARQHIEAIKRIIVQRGRNVSIYNIALAWNGGPDRVSYSKNTKDYARRIENLYHSFMLPP